jgi:hypothetical protein
MDAENYKKKKIDSRTIHLVYYRNARNHSTARRSMLRTINRFASVITSLQEQSRAQAFAPLAEITLRAEQRLR